MASSSKPLAAIVGGTGGIALLALLLFLHLPSAPVAGAPPSAPAAAGPTLPAPAPPGRIAAPPAARAPFPPVTDQKGSPFSPFSFLSPEATVSTQVRLLQEGNDEAFRETFVPALRDQVTPAAIAACRKRLAEVRVQPDWEMAEDSVVDGHKVQRVSMWGKGLTGFHDVGGKWLADGLWCVPYGLP